MNFAEAVRKAKESVGLSVFDNESPKEPEPFKWPHLADEQKSAKPKLELYEKAAQQPNNQTAHQPSHQTTQQPDNLAGASAKLELFLSPDQLRGVLQGLSAANHSVMTLEETADYLRSSTKAVTAMAVQGEIPAILIENKWRFMRNLVEEWLNKRSFRKEMEA